ncbi:ComF family protein [Marinicella meishanensis]|uniref:ComF family protein n=1 Tax=Marinicella meishanensis TaxID=2873263 RepID=UPI001CBBC408|nr:ComF family protein [Marinicella sp. NBU2979]
MRRCVVCQVHTPDSLCVGCQTLIQAPANPCVSCAKPMPQADSLCGECRSDPPAFSRTLCATLYQAPVSTWVQQLKFGERLDRARVMAECLMPLVQGLDPTVPLVPLPLHRRRLLSRGFNQAQEIARLLAKAQARPLLDRHLQRVKNTAMQAELSERQRAANVRAAFTVVKPITATTVLLLDDVMTTGQTMRAAAQCLKQAGVAKVIAVVFARSGAAH